MNVTVTIIALLLIFFIVMTLQSESFDTLEEKRDANKKYFEDNKKPSYTDYRDTVPEGHFVDYDKYKKEFA